MSQSPGRATQSLLRGATLFRGVSAQALAGLEAASRLRRLSRGQVLFSQGDSAETFYVVCSGCLALGLDSPNGRELVINEMRAGDGFGELALLTGQPRSASAVASEDSVVLAIPRREFLAVLESEPALMRNLLQIMAQRLGTSSEREGALAFLNAPSRLARVLLQLDRQARTKGYITISQEDLGRRVGLARQTVAELLGTWRRSGWILTGRGKIVLLNRAALRRLAEEETAD
ncbi:MAG: Crp/Fnr family transcriptional regulator [Chloroflexi bacterium]|nr:Crp/Fnr family transcriptional regulator [Chloroflexota bacterium]